MFVQTAEGQLKSAGGLCVVLAANSPVGGGVVHLEDCHAAATAGDGRSFWSARASIRLLSPPFFFENLEAGLWQRGSRENGCEGR